jgi:hypothetical protein
MKFFIPVAVFVLGLASLQAQKVVNGPAISGTMDIVFNTRLPQNQDSSGKPEKGVKDTYKVNLKAGSTEFKGTVERMPRLTSSVLGREAQRGQLFYSLALSVGGTYLGDWLGTVVTNDTGQYLWNGAGDQNSKPRIQIQAVGNQAAFTDFFSGIMIGKGSQPGGSAKFVRKLGGGKVATYTAENIDPMDFRQLVIAKGPLGSHYSFTVDGKLIYDRESGSWITEGIKITPEGAKVPDKITGSIRWVEDPNRASNGKGEYILNLRWNEDRIQPNEESFTGGVVDEDSFFAVDKSKPGLTGKISYDDKTAPDGKVIASKVVFDVIANNLERNQVLSFLKLWLVGVGPLNDE